MKRFLLFFIVMLLCSVTIQAQVTRINNNNSLEPIVLLNNNVALAVSSADKTLWATDGTLGGTVQLSTNILVDGDGTLLNGKYIFGATTAATGAELFVTDGTPAGTKLLVNIETGASSSNPSDGFVVLDGYAYFTATTASTGRELWRTNGTSVGTTIVKDIFPGATGSNIEGGYKLFSTGNYLLFAASGSISEGIELWRSDGTELGTGLLKNINGGAGLSSNPQSFFYYNNLVLFAATEASSGDEIWKTDGTPGGTTLLKDINPGTDSSTSVSVEIAPGFNVLTHIFYFFHEFNGNAYFMAVDGTGKGGIWRTDGLGVNTSLVKEMADASSIMNIGFALFYDAFNLSGKFLFPFAVPGSSSAIWECDGTPGGTKVFKSFPVFSNQDFPLIYLNLNYHPGMQTVSYAMYNGLLFFSANDATSNELWTTDGTLVNTKMVTDINPTGSGIDVDNLSYLYTTSGLYFAANDGVHGNELWTSDATSGGTKIVQDINLAGDATPSLHFIVNGKIVFTATDGDDPAKTDLFVVEGNFSPVPIKLSGFSVASIGNDALLKWSTMEEQNTKSFTIQSSYDAINWNDIASVHAAGNSTIKRDYSYTDIGIMNSGKAIIYYRLVSINADGQSSLSKVISLKLNGVNWDVQLVSNPVMGWPKLSFKGASGTTKISIINLNGKTIYNQYIQNPNGIISIPARLSAGAYILLVSGNRHKKSFKIIKE